MPVLILAPGLATAQCGRPADLGDGWATGTAAEAGLPKEGLCALEAKLDGPEGPNIHGLLIARGGKLVFEFYGSGDDQPWGEPPGSYEYDAETLHDVRSISKSVVSLLIGIALERKLIGSLDDSVFDYLPKYRELRTSEKATIRIRDLLTMTSGLVSNEPLPYSSPNSTERLMAEAEDPYRFVLERKILTRPGERFSYSGGSTMLLSAVLAEVTQQPLDAFARDALFGPLGIKRFEWKRLRRSGEVAAYGGLRLTPRDLARIGALVLSGGEGETGRIVSSAWVEDSTTPRIDGWYPDRYGYHWWIGRSDIGAKQIDWIAAFGIGGQRLFVAPSLDLMVVVAAGMYAEPEHDAAIRALWETEILAKVVAKP
jgi:CubicO group peptidase (beta-lactamase class C family)